MLKHPLRWSAVVLYCGLIFFLSSLPSKGVPLPHLFWGADKILHALGYALLSFLLAWALGLEKRTGALIAIALASFYGVTDEVHQAFVPGREASAWDWFADTVGASLALWRRLWS
ncbi:MAG: VanZ family protein [Dehalococcoidia bacterium]